MLLLAPAAPELIGQAPLLLYGLGLLDDGHVLRVVKVNLRRLGVWVHGYWVRVRELVALRAAVVRLGYFTRWIRLLGRDGPIVQPVDIGVLLGLLLVYGLRTGVAGRRRVARRYHRVLICGRGHVRLIVLEHHGIVFYLILGAGYLLEVQEALRTRGHLSAFRLRLTLRVARPVTASEPPRLLHLGLVILLILQLRVLHVLVALAHRESRTRMTSRCRLCRVVLVRNLLMSGCLGACLPRGREQRLRASDGDIAGIELSHAAAHLPAHAAYMLTCLRIVVALRRLKSALCPNVAL